MTSPPLGSTPRQTTSGVACHHHLWKAQKVGRCRARHAIVAFGQHTRSNYVGRGMPSSPLGSKNGRTTSGVACHHHLWSAHTVERRRALHASIALRQHTQSKDIGRGMTSPSFDSTHDRTTSGVTCHPRLWTAHTVERRWAWNNITAFGQHTRSNNVGRDMPLPPFDSTFCRTTSGVACHYRRWAADMVERCQVWHDITTLGLHARSDDVGRGMTSPPLDSTHGRTT